MASMTQILYCDDESSFKDKFKKEHQNSGFDVEVYGENIKSLLAELSNRKKLPDLLVLDLYHTRSSPSSPETLVANAAVDAKLAEINVKLKELEAIVSASKDCAALDVLEELRKMPERRFKKLPVLIYTRQGLSLLGDEKLRRALELRADWMVKGRGVEYQRDVIRHTIERFKPPPIIPWDVKLTLWGAATGVVLGAMFQPTLGAIGNWLVIHFKP